GVPFPELAAERSTDTGSGLQGGVLACTSTDEFRRNFVTPFVDGALDAEIDVPTDPVESDFGFHIIRVRPFDEVRAELDFNAPDFVTTFAVAQLDVWIDPRYGTMLAGVVVPLT
ncbi:MAG: peptidylprolyl isomerase, partial [Ilumatobacteraceae bacterium]